MADMKTMEQWRAKHALAQICDKHGNPKKLGEKYKSYVAALPANILQNGLGQAMAMELSADGDAHKQLYDHIQEWLCLVNDPNLCPTEYPNPNRPYPDKSNLIQAIIDGNQQKYIQAQAEALAYLDWLKKFANAYLT